MGKWKGNLGNPVPHQVQETVERSEKIIGDNRAEHLRRDTDAQKNVTISLDDIDAVILLQLEQLQLQVEDQGKVIKVPFFYGSPERWVSAQRDGYIRDKQGKIILPAIVLKRTNSENDTSLQFFNRYLTTSVMKLYSEKNAYTQFSTIAGQNAPINEVFNVVMPKHMVLTYHFIVWTSSVEQMNKLVEKISFNTQDYWGSTKGFRFRTKIESYGHTIELQSSEERIVKTEFDLLTHGYILPDSMTKLENHEMTTQKYLTPKKVVFGVECSSDNVDLSNMNSNREKWRNPYYANLPKDEVIETAETAYDAEDINKIQTVIKIYNGETSPTLTNSSPAIFHYPAPTQSSDPGSEGWISYDKNFYYIYTNGQWKRIPVSVFQ